MSQIKLSEIRARDQSAPGGARFDVPYLLDLVKRMGKALGNYRETHTTAVCICNLCKEARELLEELKL